MDEKISVLVVDDAAFMRKAVTEILESDDQIQVVDTARNGKDGLQKIKALHPDVVTLDIDMPIMDGLTTIRHLMIEAPVPIVVLSSLFSDGAITFDALRLGVVDFVPKPSGAISENIDRNRQQIIERIKIACSVNLSNIRRVRLPQWNAKEQLTERYGFRPLDYLVAIGTSLSGPNTVIRLLTRLSPALPAAVVVVQEISPKIIASFVKKFDEHVPWRIEEARDGMPLEPGTCYISSNETSLSVNTNGNGSHHLQVAAKQDEPLNSLFVSAADAFRQNAIGLLLTGLGDDGARGFARIREQAGFTIAQEAECCVYPNLTHNAIARGVVDCVTDETRLAEKIEDLMR
jgi:two-component system chemotaxis response regulator CheB